LMRDAGVNERVNDVQNAARHDRRQQISGCRFRIADSRTSIRNPQSEIRNDIMSKSAALSQVFWL
jgi:hypothetical protein